MKTVAVVCLLSLLAIARGSAQAPKLKDVKIRGYVTEVRSLDDFDIEDYRITRDQNLALDFENASPEIRFQLEDVRVGVELEIKGTLNEQTGELKAKAIKVDLEQFKVSKQTAFVAKPPQGLEGDANGWRGELNADGQTIVITPGTQVVYKLSKSQKKVAQQRRQSAVDGNGGEFSPLFSLDQVTVGMAMTYEGKRDRDTGKVIAERVEFATNELEPGEVKMWKSLKTAVKGARGLNGGELKIDKIGKFKLLPDDDVQAYVRHIGESLIPSYQSSLAPTNPAKIPFQFFVVIDRSVNAFATPNGIVVVNSGLLDLLDNEAQSAAVVGHEIVHATYEHTYRAQQYQKGKRIGIALAGAVASAYGMKSLADVANLVNAAVVNGHQRALENQADRVGLEYMLAAGYDPREAPAVWKLMAQKNGVNATNFFWSNHDNEPTRRSYLMNELKNNYRNVEFSALRTNPDEYLRMKAAAAAASQKKAKIKVVS